MTEFERIVLRGEPYDRGYEHGERLSGAVAANVETYTQRFDHEGVDLETLRDGAERYVGQIERENPSYAAEMRGIAEGSGVSLTDVATLNVRWEVLYPAWKEGIEGTDATYGATEPPVDGCTSFGVRAPATADDACYVGQNWDWLSPIAETIFLVELRREDAPDALYMTEAGIVGGKVGLNEHGIGLAVNGLISTEDGRNEFERPYHVRFREVLDADRFDDALRPVVETDRVCSANVLLGHAAGEIIDLEAAPSRVGPLYPEEGVLTHSNHFVSGVAESVNERRGPSTLYRAARLRRLLSESDGALGEEEIGEALRDHFSYPASICKHVDTDLPEEEYGQTNASLILDLGERRILAVRGPPCEGEYREYKL
ncbi:C45 family peptidase [Natronorarus salvus]|uniref:C45 family peptidase n=1 Tax=Natronorarus salvus TaxID=3117733 RepID=UPI002F263938